MISTSPFLTILIAISAIVVAITVHEFCHGLVSYWLGDDTAARSGRLSLNPLSHIDLLTTVALPLILILMKLPPFGAAKPVPIDTTRLRFQEYGMALVSLAGPISNLLLALIGGIVLHSVGTLGSAIWVDWWIVFISVNIGFFIFNLIPFPPLDGSRVLYAFAPEAIQKVMMQIESLGFFSIILFMFVIFPFMSPILQSANQAVLNWVIGL